MLVEVDQYQSKFERLACAAIDVADVDQPDMQIAGIGHQNRLQFLVAQSSLVDIHVSGPFEADRRHLDEMFTDLYPEDDRAFLWRGLLRYDVGTVSVEDPYDHSFLRRPEDFSVRVMSSPEAVNEAQRTLGRRPGEDALELVRAEAGENRSGVFTAGQQVEHVARLQIPIPELTEWHTRRHDMQPSVHVLGWLCMPAEICLGFQAYAQHLIEKYGDKIHLPPEERPAEVELFAKALDNYIFQIKSLFQAMYRVEDPEAFTDEDEPQPLPVVSIWHEAQKLARVFPENEYDPTLALDFAWVGIVPEEWPLEKRERALEGHVANIVAHMAGLLLTLEEKVPKEHDSLGSRRERIRIWRGLADHFGARALATIENDDKS